MSVKNKTRDILSSRLFISSGLLLPTALSKGATVEVAATFSASILFAGGLVILFIRRIVVVQKPAPEQKEKRQIVISVNDNGRVDIEAWSIELQDSISILEISKHQLINQFTQGGGGHMETVRRK